MVWSALSPLSLYHTDEPHLEIYQASEPVLRFANAIASQGYVCAVPSCFHEFAGTEALPYDVPGTDAGNKYKKEKRLDAYDSGQLRHDLEEASDSLDRCESGSGPACQLTEL